MDIELARTFLAVVETGSFVRAADRLHLTQTAVSARIKSLEQQLRRPVFNRSKAGASLTSAGEQFLRYAPTLIQVWERARQQVAVPAGHNSMLALGAELSLWNPTLRNWMIWMRRVVPGVALRAQVGLPDALLQQVAEGILDLAVVYAPRYWPGLTVDMIFEERLILVTTDPDVTGVNDPGYVYVDWGPEFATHHRMNFPHHSSPGVQVGLGPLGLDYILEAGGIGYFRQRVAEPHVAAGRLHVVPGSPEFVYPVYAVHASDRSDAEVIGTALRGMREAALA